VGARPWTEKRARRGRARSTWRIINAIHGQQRKAGCSGGEDGRTVQSVTPLPDAPENERWACWPIVTLGQEGCEGEPARVAIRGASGGYTERTKNAPKAGFLRCCACQCRAVFCSGRAVRCAGDAYSQNIDRQHGDWTAGRPSNVEQEYRPFWRAERAKRAAFGDGAGKSPGQNVNCGGRRRLALEIENGERGYSQAIGEKGLLARRTVLVSSLRWFSFIRGSRVAKKRNGPWPTNEISAGRVSQGQVRT